MEMKEQKPNGYCIVVGINKGSGWFQYFKGNKKNAKIVGEKMKEQHKLMFKQQQKLYVDLKPTILKKCNSECCDKLTEEYEYYCLRCESILSDLENNENEYEKEY